MKIWRVNNHHPSKNTNSRSNDVVVLGGTGPKATTHTTIHTKPQHSQQQQPIPTKSVLEMKDPKLSLKNSSNRMPSLLFLSSEPNHPPPATTTNNTNEHMDDARNDTTTTTKNAVMESSPKVTEKKEPRKSHLKMNMGRNNHKKNHPVVSTNARKSSSSRDLPEGEVGTTSPIVTTTTPSSALSRLLFTKQHLEQREQMKVEYNQFGPCAPDILTVEPDDGMPSPEHADHVIVKVQVRFL